MSEPAAQYPLLMFGQPTSAARAKLTSGRGGGRLMRQPTAAEQQQRLGGKWGALQRAMEEQSSSLATDLAGTDPELVLVMEIIGDLPNFVRAVQRIEGFEYLAELDEEEIEAEAFVDPNDDSAAPFTGTLFLLASNQHALSAVLQLWEDYQADPDARFQRGFADWKHVFELLVDLRRWSPRDRLRGTGVVEDFNARVVAGQEIVPAEIELWFRNDEGRRGRAEETVSRLVSNSGGEVVTSAAIPAIAYHAILVRLPIAAVRSILEDRPADIALIRAEEIAFVRPEAQAAVALAQPAEPEPAFAVAAAGRSTATPLVGVLDGLPLALHSLLDGRVVIDDPDDWESDIPAADRQHGTAVASLVVHGDRGSDGHVPLRPIYARPVLVPETGWLGTRECVPHDQLPVDVIHRAVLRMLDQDSGAASPDVKLINISLGDAAAQLATALSPWARLLDYLSYRFRVIFVVSAGNHSRSLVYPRSIEEIEAIAPDKLRIETLRLLISDAHNRRILSPSEAVNCLCIGASHEDAYTSWPMGSRRDLLPIVDEETTALPSPLTAVGMGYRRSIKPDLLAPGGRVLFRARPGPQSNPETVFDPVSSEIGPGLSVATPTLLAGALNGVRAFHGTSGAAAICSHYGALVLEELAQLQNESREGIDSSVWAVLTKALLVHGAALPPGADELREAFGALSADRLRDAVSRFYGYGVVDAARLLGGSEQRATAIGWGELGDEEAELYQLPLPPSLAGNITPRRLVITVAYISPIRLRNRRHRAAEIFVNPDLDTLRLKRVDASWRTVRRGTVQHEILAGDRAAAFVDGDVVNIQVNCRSLVGPLADRVPYGLAVTLEAAADLPIYTEISTRLRAQARTRVRTR